MTAISKMAFAFFRAHNFDEVVFGVSVSIKENTNRVLYAQKDTCCMCNRASVCAPKCVRCFQRAVISSKVSKTLTKRCRHKRLRVTGTSFLMRHARDVLFFLPVVEERARHDSWHPVPFATRCCDVDTKDLAGGNEVGTWR